jgi:hypothetical protein
VDIPNEALFLSLFEKLTATELCSGEQEELNELRGNHFIPET